jgi:hypothetical protein
MFIADEPIKKEKPHKGRIKDWRILHSAGTVYIAGRFLDHPSLGKHGGNSITSPVLRADFVTGEIETRNSRYTLISLPDDWDKVQEAMESKGHVLPRPKAGSTF